MAARAFAAVVFVALFGWVLAQPLIQASDDSGRPPRRGAPAGPVTASPAAAKTPAPEPRSSRPTRGALANRYPRACLRPVSSPGPQGLVAAASGRTIRITTIAGDVRATIRAPGGIVSPPLAWSPSGRILAAGAQGLFWRPNGKEVLIGDVQHGLVDGPEGKWGWSPLSDCGVQVDAGGALKVAAANPFAAGAGRVLVEEGVESFSFSSDGSKLALVIARSGRTGIWMADLESSPLRLLLDLGGSDCCSVSLRGWTPDSTAVLHQAGPGASVMADGWPLRTVSLDGELESWGTVTPGADLEWCGRQLLGVVGSDRHGGGGRLAILRPGEDPVLLTPAGEPVSAFACSPDARFIAAERDARLVLLDASGAFLRTITDIDTPNGQWSEGVPEWGPPRTGILFVRSMHLQTGLWFLPEGAPGELFVVDNRSRTSGSGNAFDWGATAPNGLPAR